MKKGLMLSMMGLLAFAGVANAYTLVKSGNWTMNDSSSATAYVEAWDPASYVNQTLNGINLSVYIGVLTVTSTETLNFGEDPDNTPFATVTLTINGGAAAGLSTSTAFSGNIATTPAVYDSQSGTYTYSFIVENSFAPMSLSSSTDKAFYSTSGDIAYTVSFDLDYANAGGAISSSAYTIDASGRVDATYGYSGVIVPEPATGALALAGIGMLFARRRRVA